MKLNEEDKVYVLYSNNTLVANSTNAFSRSLWYSSSQCRCKSSKSRFMRSSRYQSESSRLGISTSLLSLPFIENQNEFLTAKDSKLFATGCQNISIHSLQDRVSAFERDFIETLFLIASRDSYWLLPCFERSSVWIRSRDLTGPFVCLEFAPPELFSFQIFA